MNNKRASANGKDMTNHRKGLTRQELQQEALAIECLLDAAVAFSGAVDARDETIEVISYAQDRAKNLNAALDSVSEPQVVS